jgi:hypothetical protein
MATSFSTPPLRYFPNDLPLRKKKVGVIMRLLEACFARKLKESSEKSEKTNPRTAEEAMRRESYYR